jgi:hypothetical protein
VRGVPYVRSTKVAARSRKRHGRVVGADEHLVTLAYAGSRVRQRLPSGVPPTNAGTTALARGDLNGV